MNNRFEQPVPVRDAEHSIVYRNEREMCAWVFNCGGFWKPGKDHLVLTFRKADCDYGAATAVNHDQVAKGGTRMMLVHSDDNGRSWNLENAEVLFDLTADQEKMFAEGPQDYSADPKLDFLDRNVLVASGSTPDYCRPHTRSWVRVSTDGGYTWRPPVLLPNVGLAGVSGHGSTLVRPDGVSLIFLTWVSADGWTRRPVVYASVDGGAFWTFLSVVTPKIDDGAAESDRSTPLRFGAHRYFYPRGIVLPDGRILLSVRCQRDPTSLLWTEMFQSEDGGRTWQFLSRVNDWGAPGDITRMEDGRIACVYGYRLPPFGVRARISDDEGRTWGRELILRDDGGSWDLGYPRVMEIEPGKLIAIYYMNCKDDPIQVNGGVRHIAQTVFTPD